MSSKNPLLFRVAVSALEAESIFQKLETINRDVELMERVEKLERQNRKYSHPRFHVHTVSNTDDASLMIL
jgi:hypothetical protein